MNIRYLLYVFLLFLVSGLTWGVAPSQANSPSILSIPPAFEPGTTKPYGCLLTKCYGRRACTYKSSMTVTPVRTSTSNYWNLNIASFEGRMRSFYLAFYINTGVNNTFRLMDNSALDRFTFKMTSSSFRSSWWSWLWGQNYYYRATRYSSRGGLLRIKGCRPNQRIQYNMFLYLYGSAKNVTFQITPPSDVANPMQNIMIKQMSTRLRWFSSRYQCDVPFNTTSLPSTIPTNGFSNLYIPFRNNSQISLKPYLLYNDIFHVVLGPWWNTTTSFSLKNRTAFLSITPALVLNTNGRTYLQNITDPLVIRINGSQALGTSMTDLMLQQRIAFSFNIDSLVCNQTYVFIGSALDRNNITQNFLYSNTFFVYCTYSETIDSSYENEQNPSRDTTDTNTAVNNDMNGDYEDPPTTRDVSYAAANDTGAATAVVNSGTTFDANTTFSIIEDNNNNTTIGTNSTDDDLPSNNVTVIRVEGTIWSGGRTLWTQSNITENGLWRYLFSTENNNIFNFQLANNQYKFSFNFGDALWQQIEYKNQSNAIQVNTNYDETNPTSLADEYWSEKRIDFSISYVNRDSILLFYFDQSTQNTWTSSINISTIDSLFNAIQLQFYSKLYSAQNEYNVSLTNFVFDILDQDMANSYDNNDNNNSVVYDYSAINSVGNLTDIVLTNQNQNFVRNIYSTLNLSSLSWVLKGQVYLVNLFNQTNDNNILNQIQLQIVTGFVSRTNCSCSNNTNMYANCPAGSACNQYGQVLPCPIGYYCPRGTDITTTRACTTSGYICPPGSTSPTETLCPAGFKCDNGVTSNCLLTFYCPAGTTNSTMRPCINNNYYCPSNTMYESQYPCPVGFICRNGSILQNVCRSSFSTCCAYRFQSNVFGAPIVNITFGATGQTPSPDSFIVDPNTNPLVFFDGTPLSQACNSYGLMVWNLSAWLNVDTNVVRFYGNQFGVKLATIQGNTASDYQSKNQYLNEKVFRLYLTCNNNAPVPAGTQPCVDFFTTTSFQTNSYTCPEKYICYMDGSIQLCPPGYFCPANTNETSVKPCTTPGYLCPAGTGFSTEYPCAAGYVCANNTQIVCPQKYYCPPATWNGTAFPCTTPGYVCPAGTKSPTQNPCMCGYKCENGTPYSCDPGFYCPQGSSNSTKRRCTQPGYYCPINTCSETQTLCPRGYFCENGTMFGCPQGFYCPEGSSNSTKRVCTVPGFSCPAGTYNETQTPCPKGLKCDNGFQTLCQSTFYCPEGSSNSTMKPCTLPGYWCPSGTESETQYVCPKGYRCDNGTQYVCPATFYCPQGSSNSTMRPCTAPGYYCPPGTFNETQYICTRGYKCDNGERSLCLTFFYCPEGSSNSTMRPCTTPGYSCPPGTWSDTQYPCSKRFKCDNGRSDACSPTFYCPDGTSNSTMRPCTIPGYYCPTGTSFETEFVCPKSFKCDSGQITPCLETFHCPGGSSNSTMKPCTVPGYYCPERTSNETQYICPPRHVCDHGRKDICPATFACSGGSSNQTKTPCDIPGFLCPEGTANQTEFICPEKYTCDNGTSTLCPYGFWCFSGVSNITKMECTIPGFYCPPGSKNETEYPCPPGNICDNGLVGHCPAGFFCSGGKSDATKEPCTDPKYWCPEDTSNSTEHACPEGFKCDNGFLSPCPPGFYCMGKDKVFPCPLGTYNNQSLAQSISACIPCIKGYSTTQLNSTSIDDCYLLYDNSTNLIGNDTNTSGNGSENTNSTSSDNTKTLGPGVVAGIVLGMLSGTALLGYASHKGIQNYRSKSRQRRFAQNGHNHEYDTQDGKVVRGKRLKAFEKETPVEPFDGV